MYSLVAADDLTVLDSVQWADWSPDGRLLTATTEGILEASAVDDAPGEVVWTHDLSSLTPDPRPAPSWASQW